MTATTALRSEHDHILAMIACLRAACRAAESGDEFDVDTFRSGLDFIRDYADAWHHAKEEEHLFPALEAAGMPRDGGPIAVMLYEHELGRSYAARIAEHLDVAARGDGGARAEVLRNAMSYATLLTGHIQKENGILFNMADQLLRPEEHERLEEVYQTAIPAGANAQTGVHYEGIAASLCQRWNVDPQEAASAGASFRCG
ncbi:MAG: hemerythrin domain-containing protein [Lysobacterales bacterium]